MKKFILFLLIFASIIVVKQTTFAKDYKNYQSFELSTGKLLKNYEEKDLKSLYTKVDKRKFWGWNTEKKLDGGKAYFIYETLFSQYNDGYTAIDYKYKLEDVSTTKFSVSSTGSIGFTNSKNGTGFKNGLDASLKIEGKFEKSSSTKETLELSFKIDPGTRLSVVLKGEGNLTNGVAAHYRFWIRSHRGGFEYFEVSTLYQELEKVKI